ncbi:MAG TPA: hypothetical protein VGH09_07795 [Solirubrobacteraceae bacterium]
MSQENVDLVRSIYAARGRGDYSSDAWAREDIEYLVIDGPSPGATHGRSAVSEAVREYLNTWKGLRDRADEFRALDSERVLVLHRLSGRGKTSGLETTARAASVFHVHDREVTRIVLYFERARALADLGLEE